MRVKFKKLICATDFSDLSNQAMPYGVALAREFDAKLYICHILGLPSTAIYGEILLDPAEQQEKAINHAHDKIRELIDDRPIAWEPLVVAGHTADEIARQAEEKHADLVITATHGRSGLKRIILGSVVERLIHTLTCPILAIPGPALKNADDAQKTFNFQRILIGCDFSTISNMAFQYGLSFAQEFQSELHLIHVIEPPVYRNFDRNGDKEESEFQPGLREYLLDRLDKMVPEDARNWCNSKTALLDGKPDEELTRYADSRDIDLIVLGVRGQALVEKMFVGSTTERVIRRASCPILSVCAKVQEI